MAIVLKEPNLWEDIGNVAGLWGTKRLGEIEKTRNARRFANAEFLYNNQAQAPNMATNLWNVSQGGDINFNPNKATQALKKYSTATMPAINNASVNMDTQTNLFNPTQAYTGNSGLWDGNESGLNRSMNAYSQNSDMKNYDLNRYAEEQKQLEEEQNPTIPSRDRILIDTRKNNGQKYADYYVELIKSGETPENARAMTMAHMNEDVDNTFKGEQARYEQTVLTPMRENIINRMMFDVDENGNRTPKAYDPNNLYNVYPEIMKYNEMANRAGAPRLDINALNAIIQTKKPHYSFSNQANGTLTRYDTESGTVENVGNYGTGKEYLVNTPNGILDTRTGKIIEETRPVIRNNTLTPNQELISLQKQHKDFMNRPENIGKDETESPYYAKMMELLRLQQTEQSQPINQNQMQELIMQSYQAKGHDATVEDLKRNGLDRYISWVPR